MDNQPTDFTESNALLAIMAKEPREAMLLLRDLNETELYVLQMAATELAHMCYLLRDKEQEQ